MAKAKGSAVADQEIVSDSNSDSGSEDVKTPRKNSAPKKLSSYEQQRMKRIEENRARMEALGLKKMANSFASSLPKQAKKTRGRKGKGKEKVDEDEEYRPSEGEDELDSFSEADEIDGDGDDDDDDEYTLGRTSKKVKSKIQTPKKPAPPQKAVSDLGFADDDEALAQAIALSLQDTGGFIDVNNVASQCSSTQPTAGVHDEREGNSSIQEDMGKRKRKKSINSRVQMTEDELIIHFFQFDEAGKESINLRDLQRVAAAHDFTWSEKEMRDMVLYFDSDRDGKLSLEDFRKIAGRCNMIRGS